LSEKLEFQLNIEELKLEIGVLCSSKTELEQDLQDQKDKVEECLSKAAQTTSNYQKVSFKTYCRVLLT